MKTRLIILFLFTSLLSNAQITTLGSPTTTIDSIEIFQYDSLKNFKMHKRELTHLIGQRIYVVNNSDKYSNLKQYVKTKDGNFGSLLEGHYMTIIDPKQYLVNLGITERDQYFYPLTNGIVFQDDTDGKVYYLCYEGTCHSFNNCFVIVGHFEKMEQLYKGKMLVFITDDNNYEWSNDYQNGIFDINTRKRITSFAKGTLFQCAGISIDDQKTDDFNKREIYKNVEDRTVLLLHNDELGDFYCYAVSQDMERSYDKKDQARYKEYVLGKFLFKEDYDRIEQDKAIAAKKKKEAEKAKVLEAQAKAKEREEKEQQRIQALVKKYGQSNVNLARQGKVKIGWNKELCKEAWGEPKSVNKTTTAYGVHEQWVYSTSRYLYFDDGVLTSIQE